MRKSHYNDEFLVLLGPIISRLFTCSNEEKGCLLKSYLYDFGDIILKIRSIKTRSIKIQSTKTLSIRTYCIEP